MTQIQALEGKKTKIFRTSAVHFNGKAMSVKAKKIIYLYCKIKLNSLHKSQGIVITNLMIIILTKDKPLHTV